jgi:hypothetical protein
VDVHLETDVQHGIISARVVRCAVSAIDSNAGITYRAALAFVETCEWMREALTPGAYPVHAPPSGTADARSANGDPLPPLGDESLGAPAGASKC